MSGRELAFALTALLAVQAAALSVAQVPTHLESKSMRPELRGFHLSLDHRGLLQDSPNQATDIVEKAGKATDLVVVGYGRAHDRTASECLYKGLLDTFAAPPTDRITIRPVIVTVSWPTAVLSSSPAPCAPLEVQQSGSLLIGELTPRDVLAWTEIAFPKSTRPAGFGADRDLLLRLLEAEARGASLSASQAEQLVDALLRWHKSAAPGAATEAAPSFLHSDAATLVKQWSADANDRRKRDLEVRTPWMDFVKVFSIWQMKERALAAGGGELNKLLGALQPRRRSGLRVHLVGEGFGGEMMLGALGVSPWEQRVDSLVLLQAPIDSFAFVTAEEAGRIPALARPVGRHADVVGHSLVRVLVSTRSRRDRDNRYWYQRAHALSGRAADGFTSLGSEGPLTVRAYRTRLDERLSFESSPGPEPMVIDVDSTEYVGDGRNVPPQALKLVWNVVELARSLPAPLQKAIDDRERVVNPEVAPWRAICLVRVAGKAGQYLGTGVFVSPRSVLTAAHLVDEAESVVVQTGSGRTWRAKEWKVPSRWRTLDPPADYALILFDRDVETASFALGPTAPEELPGLEVATAGYPGDKPAATLWYSTGQIRGVTPGRITYDLVTAPGMAGAPVWRRGERERAVMIGIHVGSGSEGKSGVQLTPAIVAAVQRWQLEAK